LIKEFAQNCCAAIIVGALVEPAYLARVRLHSHWHEFESG